MHAGSDAPGSARVQVRATRGRHTSWRWACVWLTQLVWFGLPWLSWNGHPLLLFDLPARQFHVLGKVLWPQELIYLALAALGAACALLAASALWGRIACGYACPHTVYTDIFMWIERRIEGGPAARLRLARSPYSARKLGKRALKHAAWALFACWTGLTLVAYFTPMRTLLDELARFALGPWETCTMAAYAALAYLNAGVMRERFCRFLCPWGRLQGAMLGPATLAPSYDAARGEPRAVRNRSTLARAGTLGDCVDCTLCVQVCPSGSDIRRGAGADCISCGACIDACNLVMDKIGAPRGLIRYARAHATPGPLLRAAGPLFALLLAALGVALAFAFSLRVPLQLSVEHERTQAARAAGPQLENVFLLHIINTDQRAHRYLVTVSGIEGIALASRPRLELAAGAARTLALRVRVERARARAGANPIAFEVSALDQAALRLRREAVFLVPAALQ
ncbi:MAG: cytochrome c oxidase accessory protein CcoG [Telluria sp.]|nr:cytochrome c oxidase accessory protein CcoG [Telluria sp.]